MYLYFYICVYLFGTQLARNITLKELNLEVYN